MSKESFRVFFMTHHNGAKTGILIRTWAWFFEGLPPSAYGATEQDVYDQLEQKLATLALTGRDTMDRYLWRDTMGVRRVTFDIHPQTIVKKRPVIGASTIPLRLSYAWTKTEQGAYRIMLPRFDWWLIVESLDIAKDVLRNAVSSALLGGKSQWMYDFRTEGDEYIREWMPKVLVRSKERDEDDEDTQNTVLDAVAEEWVRAAAQRKLPVLLGHPGEFESMLSQMRTVTPPSLLIVGPPGAGKTAWVQRLAGFLLSMRRAGDKHVHTPKLWATSADRLIAGMVYLGMWQERCLQVANTLSYSGDYLYIGPLGACLKPQSDGSSIADIFIPYVQSKALSCIAECTPEEYERFQKSHTALLNSMRVIRIDAQGTQAATRFLQAYQARLLPAVSYHPSALRRLVRLLELFQRGQSFPGKGVRFVRWLQQHLGAQVRPQTLSRSRLTELFATYSNLPLSLVSDEVRSGADEFAAELGTRVLGQPDACAVCGRVLARFKTGMSDPDKPYATLFFVGPTGVGKTELAKVLTETMFGSPSRMIRLDMSEYMLPGSSVRLLDAGENVQSLATRVRQQPLSLILLDEIEKAHDEVFDLLLGVLDEGRLTDTSGRRVDLRSCVIVMTSNLGVKSGGGLGFSSAPNADLSGSLRAFFRPEFFGRLDAVVTFRALEADDLVRIVALEERKINERVGLKDRNIRVEISAPAVRRFAQEGAHPDRGARLLKRTLEEEIITPISVMLAQEPALRDRVVRIVLREGAGEGFDLEIEKAR